MHKIMIVESISSQIKNYTQLFKFGFEIYNSDELRLNLQSRRLKN